MYQHSTIRIKLIQKVSEAIDVRTGTEQGHPMSPELFKMFVYDLSSELEIILDIKIPDLNDYKISHLLWADDLILLAEDERSLQKLLNILSDFVSRWELSINISKTNIMVFNINGRILNCSRGFTICGNPIESTKSYCYLGIMFNLNGSFKLTMDHLSTKALRAYFSLKRSVESDALTSSSLLKLYDALIKPIATYSCSIWLPSTNIIKAAVGGKNMLECCTKDKVERTHLKMLKWIFGIHRKASNAFCYGDSGRTPLAISTIAQCINYYRRVRSINSLDNNCLIKHAFEEQKGNEFEWYKTWSYFDNVKDTSASELSPSNVQAKIADDFIKDWESALDKQNKLKFYKSVKSDFKEELYLKSANPHTRRAIARLRSSAHDLRIERGRYSNIKHGQRMYDRLCRFCCVRKGESKDVLLNFENLPFYDPIMETEAHMITVCPAYHHLRIMMSEELKLLLVTQDYRNIWMCTSLINEFGTFLSRCYTIRNGNSLT